MSSARIGELLPSEPRRVLLVVGKASMKGVAERLTKEGLQQHDTKTFGGVTPNPTGTAAGEFRDVVRNFEPDWIIAIGGGSVLDVAKAGAVLAAHEGGVGDYLRGERVLTRPGTPVLAIPTTAGTGSEVTPFASLVLEDEMRKISLTHEYLYPQFAILDPSLTYSLPERQTAISGMDTLCHGIEAYWSLRSTPVTDALAFNAFRLALTYLEEAVKNPGNIKAREKMLEASLLGGLAVSNARTTAAHAASYPITVHFDVPHGEALGLVLPSFIRYNGDSVPQAKVAALLGTASAKSMDELALRIEELRSTIGLAESLSDRGLNTGDL